MKNEPGVSLKPLCRDCKHESGVLGSAHSSCHHPSVSTKARGALIAALGGGISPHSEAAAELEIQANPHGIRNGWFNWPYNFDPLWLTNCNGFEEKGEEE